MLSAYHKLLIANRGEIACRIIKTAKQLGIKTVAVYSDADSHALHTKLADEAYYLGPAPSRESYLCIDKILAIAEISGANAIHPGYGFLAENPDFADACVNHGVVFIGPPASAIRAMGSKSAAKAALAPLGIPLIPGYHGADQSLETLQQQALQIGFPLLIKAAAGGGGRGMRLVTDKNALRDAIDGAKRESLAAFGDDTLLLEKYLEKPRHIEIQLFADSLGQAVYLFERDCSIQRRHQKIIEEAPAIGLPRDLIQRMGEAAVLIAKTIGYEGAGTIEFLVDEKHQFFFMEMNTRLQVEHPVTEKITGLDLVEWQLRIAAGEPLPLTQEMLSCHGHAIEVRLCAEDPYEGFTPASGLLTYVELPETASWVRVDTGFGTGDTISRYYDSMIAKLIVWGETREQAIVRLQQALTQYHITGLATNRDLLLAISQTDTYRSGDLSTRFITDHPQLLQAPQVPTHIVAMTAGYWLLTAKHEHATDDINSPWHLGHNWQNGLPAKQSLRLKTSQGLAIADLIRHEPKHDDHPVAHALATTTMAISVDHSPAITVTFALKSKYRIGETLISDWHISIDGEQRAYQCVQTHERIDVFVAGEHYAVYAHPTRTETEISESELALHAPMPAAVIAIPVQLKQNVKQGEPLMVLEAMKMEHTIFAPFAGTVTAIYFAIGNVVQEGSKLVELEPEAV